MGGCSFFILYMKTSSAFIKLIVLLLLMPFVAQGATTGVHSWAENSVLNEGEWVKIALNNTYDGIYSISYSQLRSWGFNNPEQVGVYGFGGHALSESFAQPHIDDLPEVKILHDKANQRILFYGQGLITWSYNSKTQIFEHKQHPYATQAYYFVHQKTEGAPAQLDSISSNTSEHDTQFVSEFDEYWLYENDRVNIGQTGREMFGESFINTQWQKFRLPELWSPEEGHTLKGGTAHFSASFVVNSTSTSKVTFALSQSSADGGTKEIGSLTIGATTGRYAYGTERSFDTSFDSKDLTEAAITVNFAPGNATPTTARLNYLRLQGKMDLEASDKEAYMLFRNQEALNKKIGYEVAGITTQMQIWDVTNPLEVAIQQTEAKNGNSRFVASRIGIREYAIVNLANSYFPGVTRIGKVQNQNLHNAEEVDFLIVSANTFVEQAQQLANYRQQHDGLRSLVVTPEQIYNEYSSGTPDATAIRLFAKQFYDRYGTIRYLLLWGDGSYDNRKQSASNVYLPTYQSEASMIETSSFTCDDYFGFLDDNEGGHQSSNGQITVTNDRLDIGIGRLPVSSITDSKTVLQKILDYSNNRHYGAWKNRLVFLSDDDKMDASGTDSPNVHMRHNDQLIGSLEKGGHNEYIYQKIYLPAYQRTAVASGSDYPDARRELNTALQQGSLLVNYAGHGSAGSITHEMLMNNALAKELRMKNLPLWVFASCDVMRFDADEVSMAEDLLLNPNGGASAVIGSARVVYADKNLAFNQALVNHLFDHAPDGSRLRLGDMIRSAKLELANDYNKLNFGLLGDPSMTLSFPDHKIVVDEVKYEDDIQVNGHIETLNSQVRTDNEIDTTFNGLIYSTIYGAAEPIVANKGLWQEPAYTFSTRTKRVFSGRDIVANGRFSFRFFVPQDLAESSQTNKDQTGLINLYACNEENEEVNGFYQNFDLNQIGAGSLSDTLAPKLHTLFLDSPEFRNGDIVGTTPFFYAEVSEESGFNTTGNSIGHDVTLTISSTSNPLISSQQYNLNDYFTTFTGNAARGNVKYSIGPLEEGSYNATFRIWDAFNNPLTYTFSFTVSAEQAPEVTLLQAYPSPIHQGETVTFRAFHNRPESADQLHIQVYTQTGVKVFDKTASSSSAEVVYLQKEASAITQISSEMNADETSQLQGCTTMQWNVNVAPGVYMYRAFFSSGGAETSTKSKILIVL